MGYQRASCANEGVQLSALNIDLDKIRRRQAHLPNIVVKRSDGNPLGKHRLVGKIASVKRGRNFPGHFRIQRHSAADILRRPPPLRRLDRRSPAANALYGIARERGGRFAGAIRTFVPFI
jgi:hypothetical protein